MNKIRSNQLVRIAGVMEMTGLSKSYIYALQSKGEFPRNIKVGGNIVAWVRVEVDQWIEDAIAASRSMNAA